IKGFTVQGKKEIEWLTSEITVLKSNSWPPSRTVSDTATASLPTHPWLLEITGYLTPVRVIDSDRAEFLLVTPENRFRLFALVKPGRNVDALSSSRVRVRGVLSSNSDTSGKLVDHTLWVPSLGDDI